MREKQPSARLAWFWALVAFTVVVQATYSGVRVLVSYRTLDLGGGAGMLGLVAAGYSLVPLFLALGIGRAVDRGRGRTVMALGTVFTVLPVALAAWAPNLWLLLVANMALGLGQLLATVASQSLIPQSFPSTELNRRFGNLTVGVSLGQALGLPLVGLVAGNGTSEANVTLALWVMAGVSLLSVPLLFGVRTRVAEVRIDAAEARTNAMSPAAILSMRGMKPAMFASMSTLATVDILTAYLPLVGRQAGLGIEVVTLVLTLRTVTSIVSRLFIPALTRRFDDRTLIFSASGIAAACMLVVPFAHTAWALAAVMFLAGFAFGLTQPLTMTWVSTLADPRNRGSVLSIRLAGNRLSQVFLPTLAAGLASFAAVGSVFVMSAALLGTASASVWANRRGGRT